MASVGVTSPRGYGRGILIKKAMDKLRTIGTPDKKSGSMCQVERQMFDDEMGFQTDENANIVMHKHDNTNTFPYSLQDAVVCSKEQHGNQTSPQFCVYCNRPQKMIVCRACGHTFKGRVRSKCVHHPGIVHLMDIECCPSCKAVQLKEFS